MRRSTYAGLRATPASRSRMVRAGPLSTLTYFLATDLDARV